MNLTLKQIKETQTIEELEKVLNCKLAVADISHRGGNLGFYGKNIANLLDIEEYLLPEKFGAYCNYLGGGLRGSIVASDFNKQVKEKTAKLLKEIGNACKRIYENIEAENGLTDEEDTDGETNWENLGTHRSRLAGVVSAY